MINIPEFPIAFLVTGGIVFFGLLGLFIWLFWSWITHTLYSESRDNTVIARILMPDGHEEEYTKIVEDGGIKIKHGDTWHRYQVKIKEDVKRTTTKVIDGKEVTSEEIIATGWTFEPRTVVNTGLFRTPTLIYNFGEENPLVRSEKGLSKDERNSKDAYLAQESHVVADAISTLSRKIDPVTGLIITVGVVIISAIGVYFSLNNKLEKIYKLDQQIAQNTSIIANNTIGNIP